MILKNNCLVKRACVQWGQFTNFYVLRYPSNYKGSSLVDRKKLFTP